MIEALVISMIMLVIANEFAAMRYDKRPFMPYMIIIVIAAIPYVVLGLQK
jgi:hypothetical protein